MSTLTKENKTKKTIEHDYRFYNKLEEDFKNRVIHNYLYLMTGKSDCYDNLEPLSRIVDKKSLDALADSFMFMADKDNKHFATVKFTAMNYNFKSNSYVCAVAVSKSNVINKETDVESASHETIFKYSSCYSEKKNVIELIEELCSDLRYALVSAMCNEN